MSTNNSVGPDSLAVTHKVARSAVTRAKDRASLCSFTFANGHRCRTPRCSSHPHFCYFHARKEAQSRAADNLGRDISGLLSADYLSACDLSSALGRVFSAVTQGHVKPRTAYTLAYLGQTLLQSIHVAEDEYINAFSTDHWRRAIRSSFAPPKPEPDPESEPEPAPLPDTAAGFARAVESLLAKDYQNK